MMSYQTIRSMSRAAARRSCAEGRGPLVVEPTDNPELVRCVPHLGDRTPKGWKKVDLTKLLDYRYTELFCDSSGFGGDDEPALSNSQFFTKIGELQRALGVGFGLSISEAGQFQCHVRVMVPTGTKINYHVL